MCCEIREEEENDAIRTVGRKGDLGQVVFQLGLEEMGQEEN